jgi:hypothetical protein
MPTVDSLSDHSAFIVGKLQDSDTILLMSKHEIDPEEVACQIEHTEAIMRRVVGLFLH